MAQVLDEEIDADYVPTEKEILEYGEWLGIDVEKDSDLLWISTAGLKAALPYPWKPCQTAPDGDIFYFNFETGESVWDHPCDERYRRVYQIELKKKYGDVLTKEDEDFLRAAGFEVAPRPCKVGTLVASVTDSGVVEISAMSMGGNVLAAAKLKKQDDSFKALERRLNRRAGEDLKLILPDGRMPDKAEHKTPIRALLELPDIPGEGAGQEESIGNEVHGVSKQASRTNKSSKLRELAPLKVFKGHGCHRFDGIPDSAAIRNKLDVDNILLSSSMPGHTWNNASNDLCKQPASVRCSSKIAGSGWALPPLG